MQDILLQNVHSEIFPLRDAAVNVIIRLVEAYESKPETLAHAIVLLDRFISSEFCALPDSSTYQRMVKASVGCFMIAVKFREVMHPCVRDLAVLTSCTCDDIREAEERIIRVLDWNVNVTTGVALLKIFMHRCIETKIARFNTAVDVADKILERCDERRRVRLSKYVSFLVQLAYCCRELTARHSAVAVTTACVIYSARILGDRSAEEELVPPFMRAAIAPDVIDGLRAVCRNRGYDFREAPPPPTAPPLPHAPAPSFQPGAEEPRGAAAAAAAADGFQQSMQG